MKISELIGVLTAELITGEDREVGFTVPLDISIARLQATQTQLWHVNGIGITSDWNERHLRYDMKVNELELCDMGSYLEILLLRRNK